MPFVERVRLPKTISWKSVSADDSNNAKLREAVDSVRRKQGGKILETLGPGDHTITPKWYTIRNLRRYALGVGGLMSDIVHVPTGGKKAEPSVERKIERSAFMKSFAPDTGTFWMLGSAGHSEMITNSWLRFLLRTGVLSPFAIRPNIRELQPGDIIPIIEPSFFGRARVTEVIVAFGGATFPPPDLPSTPTSKERPLEFSGRR